MSRQDKHKVAATLRAATHKSKLLSHKFLILIPTAATLGILALVSVLFTSADTTSNTYAANLGSQITTEVDGQYYVTLTAPDVNFSVSPSKNENAAKQRIDVNVETNVAGGAKLYLSMAGSSNSLHLNGNTAQSSPVISAVPDGTDASSFPANTWGTLLTTKLILPSPLLRATQLCLLILMARPRVRLVVVSSRQVSQYTMPRTLIPPSNLAPILTV